MYNKEKLLNALNYIQSVCHKYDDCANCPMGDKDGDCLLRKCDPFNWEIKKEVDGEIWRVYLI